MRNMHTLVTDWEKVPGRCGRKCQPERAGPPCATLVAGGQLAIATVLWPVGIQPTNPTGLTLVLTLYLPRRRALSDWSAYFCSVRVLVLPDLAFCVWGVMICNTTDLFRGGTPHC